MALIVWTVALGTLFASDAEEPAAIQPDALAVLLVSSASVGLVWRRRQPVGVLALVSAASLLYLGLDYPGAAVTVVLLVALYSAAAAGHRWLSLFIILVFAGGGLLFRVLVENEPLVTVAFTAALFVAVTLHGDAVNSRRRLRAIAEERLRAAVENRERETQRRMTEERVSIARELHDVMAHTITAMAVLAGAAADVLDDDPEESRKLLESMRTSARQAMTELKATISVLRSHEKGRSVAAHPTLSELEGLSELAAREGIEVRIEKQGVERPLPAAVELTIFRAVQEALTNVIRHSRARLAVVELEYRRESVAVRVSDDGQGTSQAVNEYGFGLVGMRERVNALKGQMSVGQSDLGGFEVSICIPAEVDQ